MGTAKKVFSEAILATHAGRMKEAFCMSTVEKLQHNRRFFAQCLCRMRQEMKFFQKRFVPSVCQMVPKKSQQKSQAMRL